MRAELFGVRGSTPAPGSGFLHVGGHTSCVAISHDDAAPCLVLDAGTGLRALSARLAPDPFVGTVLLSHLHWDHIMGLPFFAAADRPGGRCRVLLPDQGCGRGASEVLAGAMAPPFFPITPAELRGNWIFETFGEDTLELEGFEVLVRDVPHKGGRTVGFRITNGRCSVAYLSDHGPSAFGAGVTGLGAVHGAALELATGVDLLIHDAQHTAAELEAKAFLGHATAEYAVLLGAEAGARRVVLFHHDPDRTDAEVDEIERTCRSPGGPPVDAAREGAVYVL